MNNKLTLFNLISWLFGSAVLAVGIINLCWGNDPFFGVFLVGLACMYFPPVNASIKERFGFSFAPVAKIIVGILIFIAALGVGELFDKIDLMMMDL